MPEVRSIVDLLIPDSILANGTDDRRRAGLLLTALLIVLIVAVPTSLLLTYMGLTTHATLVVLGVIPTLLVLPVLWITRSVTFSVHALCTVIFCEIMLSLDHSNAFAIPTLPTLVLAATAIAGRWHGIVWSALIAATAVAWAVLMSGQDPLLFGLGWTTAILSGAFGLGLWIVETSREKAAQEAAAANAQLLALQDQQAQLKRLRSVSNLASGVAHDYNNLLMVISGYAETLPAGKARGGILDAVRSATDLTGQLLTFSRLAEPGQQSPGRALDLVELLGQTEELFGPVADRPIELDLADDPCFSAIRPSQLQQILLNLIRNANEASPAGEPVQVSLEAATVAADTTSELGLLPGQYYVLKVIDQGTGMTAEVLEHAFDPFYSTKPPSQGFGLGLASSFALARSLGGTVALHSAVGQGTTAELWLPRAEAPNYDIFVSEAEPTAALTTDEAVPANRTRTILLVEDEDRIRDAIETELTRQGYQLRACANANSALAALDDGLQADALISDVLLPGVPGNELASLARERIPELPTLLISGSGLAANVSTIGDSVAFLAKPFRMGELLSVLETMLSDRSPQDGGRSLPRHVAGD